MKVVIVDISVAISSRNYYNCHCQLSRFCRQRGFPGHPLRISNIFKYWAYAARALAQ